MHQPWQMTPQYYVNIIPMQMGLLPNALGAFPVPGALSPQQLPPAVKDSVLRWLQGPPKPAVTLSVMNQAQKTMVAPDLPNRANV